MNFGAGFAAIEEELTSRKIGQVKVNYRLRDWGISVNATGVVRFRLFIVNTVVMFPFLSQTYQFVCQKI